MNIIRKIQKGFLDPESGEFYSDSDTLHEFIAEVICDKNGYNWGKWISAEDYLIFEKGWIKISNFGMKKYRYVAVSKKAMRRKNVREWAEYLSNVLNLETKEI